jgi:hypothetical protein
MDETTYRILDILSRNMGSLTSINELTKKMEKSYGGAHYANIHEKIQDLNRDGIITLSRSGRSSLISMNFDNCLIIDLLAEMELRRKQDFLRGKQEMQMLMLEMDTYLHNLLLIKSASLIRPERNARLNKAELLIHLKESDDRKSIEESKIGIHTIVDTLQKIHNIRIDYLLLEDVMFLNLLKSNERNPVREALHNKIAVLHPQDFWMEIRSAIEKGIRIIAEENEANPAKINERDLVFNLARFGYAELGPKIKQGDMICIEYIIAAIMFQNNARRMDTIPIILAKNFKKTNYDLLLFLARRFGFEGKMLGILKALRNLVAREITAIDEPIRLLESMKIEEIKADSKSMKEKLRLYNVT